MSYYAPSANKLMQLGPINWTTNKWIDLSGNGNDADLVDAYCAQFDGINDYFTIPNHTDLIYGTGAFTMEQWLVPAASQLKAIQCKINASEHGTEFWQSGDLGLGTAGLGLWMQIRDGSGGRYAIFWDAIFTIGVPIKIKVVRTSGVNELKLYINDSVTATPKTSDHDYGGGVVNLTGTDNLYFGKLGPYGYYWGGKIFGIKRYKAGSLSLDMPCQGSLLDIGPNGLHGTKGGGSAAPSLQGMQDNLHINMINGCDVYGKTGDMTTRIYWYYVPYASGVPIVNATDAATQAGYAVTLNKSCLPYRADAPLNLCETKFDFSANLPMDIMNKAPASIGWAATRNFASCNHTVGGVNYIYMSGGVSSGTALWRTKDCGAHWEQVIITGTPFSSINDHCMVSCNGKLYIMMGGDISTNESWWSVDGLSWTAIAGLLPAERYAASACVVGNNIYLMGGVNSGVRKQDLWRLDTTTNTWTEIVVGISYSARYGGACAAIGNKIYYFGGSVATNMATSTVYSWTISDADWTAEPDAPWTSGYGLCACAIGNKIYKAAGSSITTGGNQNDVYEFDGTIWTLKQADAAPISGETFTQRRLHQLCYMESTLIVFGGYDTGVIADSWLSSDLGATWATAEIVDPDKVSSTAFYNGSYPRRWYQEELNGKFHAGALRTAFKGFNFFGSQSATYDGSNYGLTGRFRAAMAYATKQTGNALKNINKFCHANNY